MRLGGKHAKVSESQGIFCSICRLTITNTVNTQEESYGN